MSQLSSELLVKERIVVVHSESIEQRAVTVHSEQRQLATQVNPLSSELSLYRVSQLSSKPTFDNVYLEVLVLVLRARGGRVLRSMKCMSSFFF